MIKKLSKLIIICFILSILFSAFPVNSVVVAATFDEIEPNDTLGQAQNIGSWSEYNSVWGAVYNSADVDVFKFSAYQGDRLAIRLNGMDTGNDFDLFVLNSNYVTVGSSTRVGTTTEIVRIDVPTSGNYYIRVVPVSMNGINNDVYYMNFYNRFKSSSYTASLSPTSISSPGVGAYSPIASVNLTSNASIPNGAMVKRVEAQGTISPLLGNTFREVRNSIENQWHKSNQGGGSFADITIDDLLQVKTTWSVRYYSLAYSSSTWSSPKLKIDYEYDQTLDW